MYQDDINSGKVATILISQKSNWTILDSEAATGKEFTKALLPTPCIPTERPSTNI